MTEIDGGHLNQTMDPLSPLDRGVWVPIISDSSSHEGQTGRHKPCLSAAITLALTGNLGRRMMVQLRFDRIGPPRRSRAGVTLPWKR